MTPKEQRELGIECMFHYPILANPVIMCTPDQLAAYTAAVESKEREKCAVVVAPEQLVFSDNEWRIRRELQEAIRSLKNE